MVYSIDYRVVFVAALSSFVTLVVLSIFDKLDYYHKKNAKIKTNIKSNAINTTISREPVIVSEETMNSLCKNMISPDFYRHTKIKNFFETDHYFKYIPNDKTWINRKIHLLIDNAENYSESLHELMLDNFDPKSIEPKTNKYISEISRAINLFNEWRKWPITDKGWKFKTETKQNMTVYTHSLCDSPLDIVRADKIYSYSVPIIIGMLLNRNLLLKLSPQVQTMNILQHISESSHIVYYGVKCPTFISNRDFLNLSIVYPFKDGSLLCLNTKVNDEKRYDKKIKNKNYIRGTTNLSIYHVRPHYDVNIQHTKITFYNHVFMNGSIPPMLLNANYMELAQAPQNIENNIKTCIKQLHKPGILWIYPNPFLKMMNINISLDKNLEQKNELIEEKSDEINAEMLENIDKNVLFPHVGYEYFSSNEYLNLIPSNNSKWIESELNIDNDIKEYNSINLDSFEPFDINKMYYPYLNTLKSALNLYSKWRNLGHNKQGWKLLKEKKSVGFKAYWTTIEDGGGISAVKSVMFLPYSVPIITGIIMNDIHLTKYNKNLTKPKQLQNLTKYNLICYLLSIKMPFIAARDMLAIRFVYILPNCEVLFGEKGINEYPNDPGIDANYVRGECTLHIWHIRPDYKSDNKHKNSVVTEYAHANPKGSLPTWLIDQLIGEQAQTLLALKKYMDSIKNKLHEPGVLHIPLDLLKSMKVFKHK